MLHDHKTVLHAQIVNALEETAWQKCPHDHIEKLAHHAFHGELWEKAVGYLMRVGEKGLATFSEPGSTTIFSKRVESVRAPSAESRRICNRPLICGLELRNPLYFLGEFDELHRCLREAESIAQRISDDRRLGRVINFLTSYYGLVGEHHRSIEFGTRGLRINRDDVELNTVTHYYMGVAYHHVGQYDQSIAILGRALSVIERGALQI